MSRYCFAAADAAAALLHADLERLLDLVVLPVDDRLRAQLLQVLLHLRPGASSPAILSQISARASSIVFIFAPVDVSSLMIW